MIPTPRPTRNKVNNIGTSLQDKTSEQELYMAAIIGPPNNPRATIYNKS